METSLALASLLSSLKSTLKQRDPNLGNYPPGQKGSSGNPAPAFRRGRGGFSQGISILCKCASRSPGASVFPIVSRTALTHVIKSLTLMRLQTDRRLAPGLAGCFCVSKACHSILDPGPPSSSHPLLPQHQHFLQHPFYHHPLTLFFLRVVYGHSNYPLLLIKLHLFFRRLICYSSHTTTKQMHLGSHWVPTFHAGA